MKQSKTYRLISCFLIFELLLSSFQTILASSENEYKSPKKKSMILSSMPLMLPSFFFKTRKKRF